MPVLHADKVEIQKQWDRNPCGASTVRKGEPGTLQFYRAARDCRYRVYGPWFDSVIRFDDWHSQNVLEIGVGLGSDHFRFAKNGNRMTALDLSSEHLRHTIRHLHLEDLSTAAVYGDAERLTFRDESFDVVYAFGVLHHTPDTQAAIGEIHRVLRPGGSAIVALYHRNSWFFWINTILANGLVHRGLFKKGVRRLLAEIEYDDRESSALPLVKVYTRRQIRLLFRKFRDVRLTTCHVEACHFRRLAALFNGWTREQFERRLGRGGWYVIVHAKKNVA